MKHHTLLTALLIPLMASCGKRQPPETDTASDGTELLLYQGEEATRVRKETIIELLAVKQNVTQALELNQIREEPQMKSLISELESLRPRVEYIQMQTRMLPESEQRVVIGNLAVATNQLKKELDDILSLAPGNDDLAMEVAHLRQQLSPIPLLESLRRF